MSDIDNTQASNANRQSLTIALTGSGGSGVVTAGQMLLRAASRSGWYGLMGRSSGPQIRGGESAAFVRLATTPVDILGDDIALYIAFDWKNVERFSAEIPLGPNSILLYDPNEGPVPPVFADSGAKAVELPLKEIVGTLKGGRANMVGLGVLAELLGLTDRVVSGVLEQALKRKGEMAIEASRAGVTTGREAAKATGVTISCATPNAEDATQRWNISGNEAVGLGAVRGGVRFVAAYPITPATEVLEWMSPNLEKVGGHLVQAEDELASINMIIGGSFGGIPSLTATSGPGLALMMESIGLAVASEIPLVIVNVMRGGPSTGIPTKSEQSDLNIAVNGLHGDAPHLVTAPNGIGDCLFTTQWTMHLAESLQTPAILLSDQFLGQSRAVIDPPADLGFIGKRQTVDADVEDYARYAVTESGISPMAVPGTPGGAYVADGLEHNPRGTPSAQAEDHEAQLDKRQRKLDHFDYGEHWAHIETFGTDAPDIAVVTWGSTTGPVREALADAALKGINTKLISFRLLAPFRTAAFLDAMDGLDKALIVEQSHSQQFHRYLRSYIDLPKAINVLSRAGPLPMRAREIYDRVLETHAMKADAPKGAE